MDLQSPLTYFQMDDAELQQALRCTVFFADPARAEMSALLKTYIDARRNLRAKTEELKRVGAILDDRQIPQRSAINPMDTDVENNCRHWLAMDERLVLLLEEIGRPAPVRPVEDTRLETLVRAAGLDGTDDYGSPASPDELESSLRRFIKVTKQQMQEATPAIIELRELKQGLADWCASKKVLVEEGGPIKYVEAIQYHYREVERQFTAMAIKLEATKKVAQVQPSKSLRELLCEEADAALEKICKPGTAPLVGFHEKVSRSVLEVRLKEHENATGLAYVIYANALRRLLALPASPPGVYPSPPSLEEARELCRVLGCDFDGPAMIASARELVKRVTDYATALDTQGWAEGLIRQLPTGHDGKDSWLLNFGHGPDVEEMRDKHPTYRTREKKAQRTSLPAQFKEIAATLNRVFSTLPYEEHEPAVSQTLPEQVKELAQRYERAKAQAARFEEERNRAILRQTLPDEPTTVKPTDVAEAAMRVACPDPKYPRLSTVPGSADSSAASVLAVGTVLAKDAPTTAKPAEVATAAAAVGTFLAREMAARPSAERMEAAINKAHERHQEHLRQYLSDLRGES